MNEQANMAARYEHEIPEGYEARIEGNKVIIVPIDSEDERIRKELLAVIDDLVLPNEQKARFNAYLEKQKEQEPSQYDIDILEKHITKDSISELAHTVIIRNGWEIVEQEQNPAKWSEEDERMLEKCVGYMTKLIPVPDKESFVQFEAIEDEECINWLKSRHPQPHWKPSKKQMETLKDVIDRALLTCRQRVPLESLYSDLKKL